MVTCIFSPSLEPRLLGTLGYLVRTHEYAFDAPPGHPFFLAEEGAGEGEGEWDEAWYEAWRDILQMDSNSTEDCGYFARFFRVQSVQSPHTDLLTAAQAPYPYVLDFHIAVHDDAEGHAWRLLQWLATISSSEGFVGYSIRHGRGRSDHPVLWYFEGRQLVSRKADSGGTTSVISYYVRYSSKVVGWSERRPIGGMEVDFKPGEQSLSRLLEPLRDRSTSDGRRACL